MQIKQPEGEREHCGDDHDEKSPCARVTERSQRGRAKCAEVRYDSKRGGGNSSDLRVGAAKNNRAGLRWSADRTIACDVRDREIGSIGQSGQCDYCCDCIEDEPGAGERIWRNALCRVFSHGLLKNQELLCPGIAASIASCKRSGENGGAIGCLLIKIVGVFSTPRATPCSR